MPPWGRPPGAQKAKGRKEREREQREWEQGRRFEELDSDSDNGQGVDLDRAFAGDDLQFTGADLGQDSRTRGKHGFLGDAEFTENVVDYDLGSGSAMQLALRDKEEVLYQRARERILRAQAMGRVDVQLTPAERDAFDRKHSNDQAKIKRPSSRTKVSGDRRGSARPSGSQDVVTSTATRRKSRSSLGISSSRVLDDPGQAVPPGFIVAGPDGRPVYAPFGYYPPSPVSPYGPSSRPNSRTGSTHSLQHTPPVPQSQSRSQQKRYFSVPEQQAQASSGNRGTSLPRPLPDDLDWQPRVRSASNLAYPSDVHQYSTYSPPIPQMPVQYAQGRRNVSGPEIGYPSLRHGMQAPRPYAANSEPSLLRREYSGEDGYEYDTSEDDIDYDDDEGVPIDDMLYGQNHSVNVATDVPENSVRVRKSRR